MNTKVRTALVGCGDIAEQGHLPALLAHDSFELVGLCDTRAQRREALGEQAPEARRVADYRELLDDADAFVLALHPEVSVDIAIELLGRGKHVLDEKPLAVSLADGERLGEAVTASRAIYQIGFVFRYCAFAVRIAELIRRVGSPASVSVRVFDERLDPAAADHRARIEGTLRNSSAITHEGSHFIDLSRLWNAEPVEAIHAIAMRTDAALPGPNVWHASMRHRDGGMLNLDVGWLLAELPANTILAVGPHGWVSAAMAGGEAVAATPAGRETHTLPAMRQNWTAQLDRFAEAIATGTPCGATFDDGWHALATTLACEADAGVTREPQP